jgi:hypothetical protein
LEAITKFPLAFPADCGVKMTLNITLSPAARVTGWLRPLTLNSVPVTKSESWLKSVVPFVSAALEKATRSAGKGCVLAPKYMIVKGPLDSTNTGARPARAMET